MPITSELLDELLKDYKSPDDMFGNDGLLQQLTKGACQHFCFPPSLLTTENSFPRALKYALPPTRSELVAPH